jgi:hypothetical protein
MGTPAQRLESERAKYPALNVDEVLVWVAWLQQNQSQYDRFDYNVRIGDGTDPGPTFSDTMRNMAIKLTQLRLDAVGYQGSVPTIFEVERRATPRSVGQLLTYDAVWRTKGYTQVNPRLVLVAAGYAPNIVPVLSNSGIDLQIVSVNFSVLAPQQP